MWVVAPRSPRDLCPSRGGQELIPSRSARTGAGTCPAISTSAASLRAWQSMPSRLSRRLSDSAPIGRPGRAAWEQPAWCRQRGGGSLSAVGDQVAEMAGEWWRERDRGLTEPDRDPALRALDPDRTRRGPRPKGAAARRTSRSGSAAAISRGARRSPTRPGEAAARYRSWAVSGG